MIDVGIAAAAAAGTFTNNNTEHLMQEYTGHATPDFVNPLPELRSLHLQGMNRAQ
jgi:hypothetical protein